MFYTYSGENQNEPPPFSPAIGGFRRKWGEIGGKLPKIDRNGRKKNA